MNFKVRQRELVMAGIVVFDGTPFSYNDGNYLSTIGKVWLGRERVKVTTISRRCAPNSGGFLIIGGFKFRN